jgi:putative membrane protein
MARRDFGATSGSERPGRPALVGLVLLPVLVGALLAWALSAPATSLDRVTAAIVNNDAPVTVNGQSVPLGRQFAAGLMAAQEPVQPATAPTSSASPSPSRSSTPTPAAAGAASPSPSTRPGSSGSPTPSPSPSATATPSFTWVLTNKDDAAEGLASGRYAAVVTVPKSFSADATSYSGPADKAKQATLTVQTTPASAWLDPAVTSVVTQQATASLNQQLISSYLGSVYDGFNTIHDQIGQAASGAHQVADGASQTAAGTAQVSSGASSLSSGLQSLDAGASSLAAGLSRLASSSASLPAQTQQLAEGSAAVSSGISTLAGQIDSATTQLASVVKTVCAKPGRLCDKAKAALDKMKAADAQISTLAGGAAAVKNGNAALANAMPSLVGGIDQADSGAAQVSSGAASSSSGSQSLASGASQAADGASQVSSGAAQLASGLDDATQQIPTYSDSDIATLSTVVAQPVLVDPNGNTPGSQSAPLFAALALWIGGFGLALAFQAVPRRRLLTGVSSGGIARRGILPVVGIGAIQGLVVAPFVLATIDATPGQWAGFAASCVFAGAVFALANLALAAVLGGVGRLIALVLWVLTLAAGLSGTVPPVVTALAQPLPPTQGMVLLRAVLGGDAVTAWLAVGVLVITGLVSYGLVVAGVAARRRVPAREIAR